MADNNQNLVQFRLTGTLSVSGTTVNVSNDILRDTAIDVESASITLQNEGGTTFELVKGTITAGVLTTSARGIKRDQTLTEDATLKKEWRPGTIGFITSFASDTMDRETGQSAVYANATARDSAITTPSNGMQVYLTTEGYFTDYVGGAWTARASGTNPNASATVAGKVEIGTQTQVDTGTDTGETGAYTVVIPSTFNTGITNKLSDQTTAETGTDNTKLMTPLRTKQAIDFNILYFGDGSDGNVTITTTVILIRDMYYNNLTITSPGILKPNGYKVFVAGTLSGNGTISVNGNNGTAGSGVTAGNGGTVLNQGTLGLCYAGGNGATGVSGAINPGNSTTGITIIDTFLTGNTGKGGNGGSTSIAPYLGGTGGQNTDTKSYLSDKSIYVNTKLVALGNTSIGKLNQIGGGIGGASGTLYSLGASGGGGGGGSSAGIIFITSNIFNFTGTISGIGGNGAIAGDSSATANYGLVTGGSGGGAGGSGGILILITNTLTNTGTITLTGGTGGNGSNAAVSGGGAGVSANGGNGGDGGNGGYALLQYKSIGTLGTITLTGGTGGNGGTGVVGGSTGSTGSSGSIGINTQIIL